MQVRAFWAANRCQVAVAPTSKEIPMDIETVTTIFRANMRRLVRESAERRRHLVPVPVRRCR